MNNNIAAAGTLNVTRDKLAGQELYFPAGLLGFPACLRYRLERFNPGADGESPFFILNSVDQNLSFPLIHPESLALNYRFSVDNELLTALAARAPDELVPFLIVTVRERLEDITLNLQGPLIINPISSRGLQLVIEEYPLRYPLLNAAPLEVFPL
jgi:flagellar assembly factor FliW